MRHADDTQHGTLRRLHQTQTRLRCHHVATDYVAPADQLVMALKFNATLTLAPLLAQLLHERVDRARKFTGQIATDAADRRTTGTTTTAGARLQSGTRNCQAAIGAARNRLEPRLLERVSETQAQSTLPLAQRRHNMRRAFRGPARRFAESARTAYRRG